MCILIGNSNDNPQMGRMGRMSPVQPPKPKPQTQGRQNQKTPTLILTLTLTLTRIGRSGVKASVDPSLSYKVTHDIMISNTQRTRFGSDGKKILRVGEEYVEAQVKS